MVEWHTLHHTTYLLLLSLPYLRASLGLSAVKWANGRMQGSELSNQSHVLNLRLIFKGFKPPRFPPEARASAFRYRINGSYRRI